jgi:hypothetical protein
MGMNVIRKRFFIVVTAVVVTSSVSDAQEAPFSVKWKWDDLTEIKKLGFTVMTEMLISTES